MGLAVVDLVVAVIMFSGCFIWIYRTSKGQTENRFTDGLYHASVCMVCGIVLLNLGVILIVLGMRQ